MTSISLINPYAPLPAAGTVPEGSFAAVQTTPAVNTSASSSDTGSPSDQSGQGSGNGTGTGGAQLAALLEKGRKDMPVQHPTPKSVIEAQSDSDPATEFLARQAEQQIQAKAAEEQRAAERMERAQAEAETMAKPEYVMPNPLPTAPILQRDAPSKAD
ncbi:MAG: hypothetical protein AB8B47_03915 [Roseobacter sp.]